MDRSRSHTDFQQSLFEGTHLAIFTVFCGVPWRTHGHQGFQCHWQSQLPSSTESQLPSTIESQWPETLLALPMPCMICCLPPWPSPCSAISSLSSRVALPIGSSSGSTLNSEQQEEFLRLQMQLQKEKDVELERVWQQAEFDKALALEKMRQQTERAK